MMEIQLYTQTQPTTQYNAIQHNTTHNTPQHINILFKLNAPTTKYQFE